MANIPQRVSDRLVAGIKKFKIVLADAQEKKKNESDTVAIITGMLFEIFGYAEYSEITSEIAIRGTYCDLATKVDNKISSLIEAKAIYHDLNNANVTQAVAYASTQGVDWVVLTNGIVWQIYRVTLHKLVDHEKIIEIDFLSVDHRNPVDLDSLFRLTKEGWVQSALEDYYKQKQALSKFSIAAILSTDSVLSVIRKNLKLISPGAKFNSEQIRSVLEQEVINKEVLDDERVEDAHKRIARALKRAEKESEGDGSPASLQPVQNPPPETWMQSTNAPSVSPPQC